jgi:predicted adenine nucleotide alpha hydrolase (AANH) superfamily ATPase
MSYGNKFGLRLDRMEKLMNRNYQKELDVIIKNLETEQKVPRLFLHSCCAPCSSYCIEYLANYFHITVFYYNPNITMEEEYKRRAKEQQKLIASMPVKYPVEFVEGKYDTSSFLQMSKGMEQMPEGGERCFLCYELRLRETAKMAAAGNYDYFTTTLTISPLKNARKLNEIGEVLGQEYHISHLPTDFKKKEGYKRSIELSKEYDLYRQDYCGCAYSMRR